MILLVWILIKLREAKSTWEETYYEDLGPPQCVTPCENCMMAFRKFVERSNSEVDMAAAMLVILLFVAAHSWLYVAMICVLASINALYWSVPIWFAVDAAIFCAYYGTVFGIQLCRDAQFCVCPVVRYWTALVCCERTKPEVIKMDEVATS